MTTQRNSTPSLSDDSPVLPAPDQTASAESRAQEVAALQQELEALRAAHEQELARLRAEMAAEVGSLRAASLRAASLRAASLRAAVTATDAPSIAPSDALPDVPPDAAHADTTTTRRNLLKWGGIGAAAALAAAGGASLTSPTAHAADGASLVLGSATNAAEHITTLTYDGSETGPTVLQVSTTANDSAAVVANAGNSVSNSAYGIYGTAGNGLSAYGVYAQAGTDGVGALGAATSASSIGVWGNSDSGYGVVGSSDTGIDMAALGAGRLFQQTTAFTGAPTSGSYAVGEQIRDQIGDLYLCVTSGSPGTWKKVSSLSSAYKGGAIGFLSTPIRVYDSRKTGGALIGNATRDVHVTTVSIGGVQVPAGATGCVGNLTVTGPTASGYVVIYPQGSSTPSTSTVNFLSGQTVANAFAVGLSASGYVTVHSFTSGQCHFIVDITGFVS